VKRERKQDVLEENFSSRGGKAVTLRVAIGKVRKDMKEAIQT